MSKRKQYLGSDSKPIVHGSVNHEDEQESNIIEISAEAHVPSNEHVSSKDEPALSGEVISLFFSDPEKALIIYETALKNGLISEEEQIGIQPLLATIRSNIELKKTIKDLEQRKEVKLNLENEEHTMAVQNAANVAKKVVEENAVAKEAKKAGYTKDANQIVSGVESNKWAPSLLAAGAAVATAGFDMVTSSDLSYARIGGTVAAGITAASVQYLVQSKLTSDQGTGVNCAIGLGVGLAVGGATRFGIDFVESKLNDDIAIELN